MRAWPAIVVALCLAACAEPPQKEIAAAEASLAAARKAGAGQFAPERLKEAETALETLRSRVEAKDYRGALSAASDAADRANEARRAAETAKAAARIAAETALTAARAVLDEVKAVRREATEAKVPDRVFASLQPAAEAAQKSLETASSALDRGELAQAEKTAVDLRAKISPLPHLFRDTLDTWQVAHGHRAPAKKP
jgi:hypothetical protein